MKQLDHIRLIVLVTGISLLALAGAFLWLHLASPSDGVRLEPGQPVWTSHGVLITPIEERSGLHEGDLLVAVEGRSLEAIARTVFQPGFPRSDWRFGETIIYTVARGGQLIDVPITLGSYPLGVIVGQEWGTIIFALTYLLIGAFVFIKRPHERAAHILFLSAASIVSATTWSFGLQVSDLVDGVGFWLFKATSIGAFLLLWITSLHLTLVFPRIQPLVVKHRWLIPVLYAAPYVFHLGFGLVAKVRTSNTLEWLSLMDQDMTVLPFIYLGLALLAMISGYRTARRDPISRLQLRWVVFALLLAGTMALVFGFLSEMVVGYALLSWNLQSLFGLLFPAALAMAILRYHLFDIDVVINRTLVYGALTAMVAFLYVVVVGSLGVVFQAQGSLTTSLLATGLVAVLFQPLRDRVQRGVNRLMYGERDEPYTVLARLGQRLETAFAPNAVLPTIVETIAQALKVPYTAIAVQQGAESSIAASYGLLKGEALRLPLIYPGETVGQLILAPRSPGESFTPADLRLLDGLAHQVAVVVHAVRLTADLQRSREQLVTAREEERRRLRRDLHDGLGQALASQALQLDAVSNLLRRDPDEAQALVADLKAQTQAVIADLRRLVYELRPPALDEFGLVSALREPIEQVNHYNGLHVSLDAPANVPPLPAAVEVAAYRITLEALTNVVRHANARHCTIRLSLDGALCLEIADDGRGLSVPHRLGVGLTSMRERAAELGGTFIIQPAPTGGTHVVVSLPLPKENGG